MSTVYTTFAKEPGTQLPENVEGIARSSLQVVRPQLFLIRDTFFPESPNRDAAFTSFVDSPLIAGYVLGIIDAYLQFRETRLTELDVLRCVLDTDSHFSMNDIDMHLTTHYAGQQESFTFGLNIGGRDVVRYLADQAQNGRSDYVLLAAALMVFLRYGADRRTLDLNLEIFCETHGVPPLSEADHGEVLDYWAVHRDYGDWDKAVESPG